MEKLMDKAIEKMSQELGADKVKSDDFFRAAYASEGMEAFRPRLPDAVVMPESEDDIRTIIKIANEFKVYLIPTGGRISAWKAIDVPKEGAIYVDMTAHMNKIIEIDEKNMSVTAQAGASVYYVDMALRERGYRLVSHPVAQPALITLGSDVAKCSCGVYGTGVGPKDRWVLGIKIILGNGDTLETGAARMIGAQNFQRYRLPDLTGLFMAAEGTLGIITEVTERFYPVPASIKPVDIEFPVTEEGEVNLSKAVHEMRAKSLYFDAYWATPTNLSWFLRSEHYLDTMTNEEIDRIAPVSPYGDFAPDTFKHFLLVVPESLISEEEALLREKEVIEIGKKYGGVYKGSKMAGMFDEKLEYIYGNQTPYIRGEFGQRINWLYWWSEFPIFELPKAMRIMHTTFDKTELSPSRFYGGAYYSSYGGILIAFAHHYADSAKETEEARKWFKICDEELYNTNKVTPSIPLGVGAIGARDYLLRQLKPYCADYLKKVKDMCDPNHIMNPGKSVF